MIFSATSAFVSESCARYTAPEAPRPASSRTTKRPATRASRDNSADMDRRSNDDTPKSAACYEADMPLTSYVTLGRSGLRVSPLCLGAMTFGKEWGFGSEPEEAKRIM